ncbi:MAG: hypothetical protein E2P02_12335, partial [Acidobacteria bacterium]
MSILVERETSAGSEGARRATGDPADRDAAGVPDPEVTEQAKRRRFTAEYKLRIVREADACKGDGDVAALLRREGLYSSHLSSWRRQRDEAAQEGLAWRKRGRNRREPDPAGRDAAGVEDPEVTEQAKCRRFTAEYKLRIVREADACKGDG